MPTTVGGQARGLLQRPDHRVERVGDADDEGVRRVLLDAVADRLHHLEIDAEQIVAAHAGLARHAGGDDDDVGAGDVGVVVGALQARVEAATGAGLGEIERLALGRAFGDVEQHDVAQLLQRRQMGERAADLAGPDQWEILARDIFSISSSVASCLTVDGWILWRVSWGLRLRLYRAVAGLTATRQRKSADILQIALD